MWFDPCKGYREGKGRCGQYDSNGQELFLNELGECVKSHGRGVTEKRHCVNDEKVREKSQIHGAESFATLLPPRMLCDETF